MSIALLNKDIENGNIEPVYLLYGEDRYSMVEGVKLLKAYFLNEDASGLGIEYLSGKDASPDAIVEACNTASFFSRRLVIVDDIPYFKTPKAKKNTDRQENENDQDADETDAGAIDTTLLQHYCQQPNLSTCLVLVSAKAHKGKKLYKEIAKAGKIIEFGYPKDPVEWIRWVQKETQSKGKQMDSTTAAFLIEWAGHHPGILAQEIAKLTLFIGERSDIRQQDISSVCIPLVETTIFAMLDAIAAGNSREALKKLREVLSREHYMFIHAMIIRQIRMLLAGSLVRRQGGKADDVISCTGCKPFEAQKVLRQAANFAPESLAKAMQICLQTDIALKRSGGDPQLLMEMMVIHLLDRNKKQTV